MSLFHIHIHHEKFREGVYAYSECRCNDRRYRIIATGGYSAINWDWLKEHTGSSFNSPKITVGSSVDSKY